MADKAKSSKKPWSPRRKVQQESNYAKARKRDQRLAGDIADRVAANAKLRLEGLPTAWERAKDARRTKRLRLQPKIEEVA